MTEKTVKKQDLIYERSLPHPISPIEQDLNKDARNILLIKRSRRKKHLPVSLITSALLGPV